MSRARLAAAVGVEVDEVNRLAHLGVALGDRLAGVARHHRQRAGAALGHHGGDVAEHPRSTPRTPRLPPGRGAAGARHCVVDALRVRDGVAIPGCAGGAGVGPGLGVGTGLADPVGVAGDLVERLEHLTRRTPGPPGRRRARWRTVREVLHRRMEAARRDRDTVTANNGVGEAPALLVEHRRVATDGERGAQVVLGRRVLLQAAHEVGNGRGEVVATSNGCVKDDGLAGARQRHRLGVGHPLEHLDVDLGGDAASPGHLQGPGEVEEVVARDAHAHHGSPALVQRHVEQARVASVDVGLGRVGRRPSTRAVRPRRAPSRGWPP